MHFIKADACCDVPCPLSRCVETVCGAGIPGDAEPAIPSSKTGFGPIESRRQSFFMKNPPAIPGHDDFAANNQISAPPSRFNPADKTTQTKPHVMNKTPSLRISLRRILAVAALAALPQVAVAQSPQQILTNWVAYNDFGRGAGTAPNVSTYDMGTGPGGPLTNLPANQFPVAELPAGYPLEGQAGLVVVPVNANGYFALPFAMGSPLAGSPAAEMFNGLVDFGGTGSGFGLGAGQYVRLTFTNLNPAMRYKFRGSAMRGGVAGTHDLRWTICSLDGAASFVSAHTPDNAPTNGMSIVIPETPLPGLTLTNGQAAFRCGYNTNGMVVGWDSIAPAADGTFTVVSAAYNGPMLNLDGSLTNASANLSYALNMFMLTEYGTPTALAWTTQPAATLTATQLLSIRLTAAASGSAAYYQWFKEGVGAIPGANYPNFVLPNAAVSDAGNYYCVATNRNNSITSSTAQVTVVADTFKPVAKRVAGSANLNEVIVEFSERVVDNTDLVDGFNYSLIGGLDTSPDTVAILAPGSEVAGTLVRLTFANPLVENTVYQLKVAKVTDLAGNEIDGAIEYSFRTWLITPANGILFEAFTGVAAANTIPSLTNSPNYPNNPFTNMVLSVFDSRAIFPDDSHENYGSRSRGLFIPPATGRYRFYVRSDDPSQVFLNPAGPSPAGKQLILDETGCCGNWDKFESPAFQMTAGQGYYLEALQKEGGGGDYVKVAARLEGTGKPTPNNTANLSLDPAALTGSAIGYPAAPPGVGGAIGITLQPASVVTEENQIVTLTVAATNTYGLPMVFQWRRDGTPIPDVTVPSYTLVTTLADNGAVFTVEASIIGAKVLSTAALLTVNADNVPPTVVSTGADQTFTNIFITFSELMAEQATESAFGYTVTGPSSPAVLTGTLQPDGLTVMLALQTPLQADSIYSVAIAEATDLKGNPANTSAQVQTWKLTTGFVTFETYNTAAGNAVSILTSDPSFPNNPRETFYIRSFDSREAYPDSSHESFGGRFTGVFIPPTSGNWLFYISVDDDGELWFNPNGPSESGKTMITSAPSCCQGFSAHVSAPQALIAGEKYYIESLYKEGAGGDYLRVAAKLDTDPTNPDTLAPIPGSMLGTFINPVGISIAITQQPTDQVGVVSSPGKVLLSQNFNGGDGGFTVTNSATAPAGPWVYTASTGKWSCNGGEGVNQGLASLLHSPTMTVTEAGPVVLTFNHRYSFEADTVRWDGGQVRLSVNGGAYTTVPASSFIANGYKTDIVIGGNNILNNQYAFSGPSDGWSAGTLIQSIVTLGTFNPGDQLSIQFAGAWDEYTTAGNPGWEIDGLTVNEAVFPLYTQDFVADNGGYTVANVGTLAGPWIYNAGTGTWSANGHGDNSPGVASLLNSPAITVSKDGFVKLTFTHRYNFEDATTFYDAGQIRLSVNGGNYTTVPAANFSSNGYAAGPIVGTGILNGQRGFTGQSAGYTNGFITSIASLGAFQAGDTLSVQFAGAWDEGFVQLPSPNWEIDKLSLEDGIAVPVTFSVAATAVVPGATTTPIAYQWQRDTGAGFEDIEGANSTNLTFFVVEADNGNLYRCIVSVPGLSLTSDSALLTIGAGAAPSLDVVRAGGNVTVSWPADASGFFLEQTSTLVGAPIPWTLVPENTYQTSGNTRFVTLPAGPNNQFFRLRKP
jgi:hypothetical protein